MARRRGRAIKAADGNMGAKNVRNVTIARRDRSGAARRWWVVAWLLYAVICGAAIWSFAAVFVPQERAETIELWRERLSTMADDRKAAITAWLDERRGDAHVVAEYPTVAILLAGEQAVPDPLRPRELSQRRIEGLLDSERAAYGYSGTYVIGSTGQVVASGTGSPPLDVTYQRMNSEVLQSGVAKLDFHADTDGSPMLVVVAPVRLRGRTAGTVLLSVDPERWLYPLLRSAPIPSATGESLLARQVGDQIEFLSPLRHRSARPLSFRLPASAELLAAVAAIRGEEGFKEYQDYRGVPVLGAARRIPGTGWGLVVKVDRGEALAGFSRSVWQGAWAIAGLLLAVTGLGFGARRAMTARSRRELGESEARFALLRDHARDGIWFMSRDGVILDANESAAAMLGCAREEVVGRNLREFRPPKEPDTVPSLLDMVGRTKGLVFETQHVRRDGSVFPAEVFSQVVTFHGEEVFLSVYRDITERKRAEEALRESEERYRLIAENTADVIWTLDLATRRFTYVSPSVERLRGFSVAEVLTQPFGASLTPDSLRRVDAHLAAALAAIAAGNQSARTGTVEADMPTKDGGVVRTEVVATALTDASGRVTSVLGVTRDITERKRAEAALRESEARYRSLFDQSPIGIYRTTPDGRILAANAALLWALGYASLEELTARNLDLDGYEPTYPRQEFKERIERDGEVIGFESAWLKKDGQVLGVRESARVVRGQDGKTLYYEGTIEDVTAQRRGEEERRHLVAAIEQASETIVITDTEGRIEYVNPAFERTSGYTRDEANGQKLSMLDSGEHDDAYYATLWQTITQSEMWQGHFVNRRKDGSLYEEEATISPIRDSRGTIVNFVEVKRDVTQEMALQMQLRQAQKMEAVGILAGGVAHDFNNLLQAMLNNVEIVRGRHGDAAQMAATMAELEAEIRRGSALTRQLLLFARRETAKPEPLDLNEVIRSAARFLRRLVRANVTFTVELADEPLPVIADRGQIDQVLMNLAVNAADAMPDGGRLTIRSGRQGEEWVWFAAEDIGGGIPVEIRERIFEPFFTTKSTGKGTGLGLSVVHGIVTQHRGVVEIQDVPGGGTSFRVALPRAGSGEHPEVILPTVDTSSSPAGHGERVLVVEDEEGARQGLAEILQMLGYDVVAVGSGEEAGLLPHDPGFDVLLTDMMLPGCAGSDLARGLLERWPTLKVILMSGYTEDEAVRRGALAGRLRFLQKPFDMATLAREIRAALDSD